jgi:hypothetical protein
MGDLTENAARVSWQSLGKVGTTFAIEGALGIEVVGAVKDTADHIPLCQSNRVIPYCIQHAPIDLALCLGVCSTCWPVP